MEKYFWDPFPLGEQEAEIVSLVVKNVWLDFGVSSKNIRQYIDVSKRTENMGPDLCDAIAGFHAFTECDYTASFQHKGKVRQLALMVKDQRFIYQIGNIITYTTRFDHRL